MTSTKTEPKKRNFLQVFLEESSNTSLKVILLAIFSGLVAGGILIIITEPKIYAAFGISFQEGLISILKTLQDTYVSLFIGAVGDPAKIFEAIRSGNGTTILTAMKPIFESLVVSTPYIFSGLALALGFRVGLLNIGAEGQVFMGATAACWAGYAIKGLPAIVHIPVALGIGALAGGLWGFVPGWLKAKTGAHEVITCIMMNYTAFNLVQFLISGPMKDPKEFTPKTPWIETTAQLPQIFPGLNRFHIGFFIALVVAFLVWYLLFKTSWGYEMRMVGLNPNAAKYAGMNITFLTVISMSLSGALAGLAGANEILGVTYRQVPSFSSGYGFDAIALALLGNNHPVGVVLAALLFGFLRSGSRLMQLRAGIPVELISILQAFIMIFIAAPAIVRTIYRIKEPNLIEDSNKPSTAGGK